MRKWPKSPEVASVKFNIASMYYQQGDYLKASQLYTDFVKEYPSHKDTVTAGNLALDSLNRLDDLEALATLAEKFAKDPSIKDRKFKREALRIAKAARTRNVDMTVIGTSEGDFSETMLGEWEKHKGTAQGEEFLYKGFVKFKSDGNIKGFFDFGGRMIGAYPKSNKLEDVFGTMGAFAGRSADFERAAVYFEEYYKRFPSKKSAIDLLASAASFRFFLGTTIRPPRILRHC
ncbi:MAG: outer membrane protein assembly factor BamD [Myxococcota bacterium]